MPFRYLWLPSIDFRCDSIICLECSPGTSQVLVPWGLPWRCQFLHDGVFCWWFFVNMRQPAVPFRRDLGCAIIVLCKIHPSVTARNLLFPVQILEVAVPESVQSFGIIMTLRRVGSLINTNKPPRLRITNVLQLMKPLFDTHPPHAA